MQPATGQLIVVGVGASAGGMEALQALVGSLPQKAGFTFMVAQHLSPSYRSMMVDLLQKRTPLQVFAAENGAKLQPNCIYICPPNHNMELAPGDTIKLHEYVESRLTPRPSVDMLFESIALLKGEAGIGIVLSGTGTDGAKGIRAIVAENGFGIVQEPETAKYDGMPNAAINSGRVDMVVAPEVMGKELLNLLAFPKLHYSSSELFVPRDIYDDIIKELKQHCDIDFRLYKENTIVRRIERRMTTLKIKSSKEYLRYMREHNEEVSFLFNDMLIGVTSFFRDARAFDLIRAELARYIEEKEEKVLRIWSVGCSTGEEAYSIAMIVTDILGDQIGEWKITIFATDIDKRAISYGRNGVYPALAVTNMPDSMRRQFMTPLGDKYEVNKNIKSKVIFSIHDVNGDPPFLRLDMVCCRNLMIYFTMELQRQLLPTLHYSLNTNGLLVLGQSESIGSFQELFRPLSKIGKVYESIHTGKHLPPDRNIRNNTLLDVYLRDRESGSRNSPPLNADDVYREAISNTFRSLLITSCYLLDSSYQILAEKNVHAAVKSGAAQSNALVFDNIHTSLVQPLKEGLAALPSSAAFVDSDYIRVDHGGDEYWVKLVFADVPTPESADSFIVVHCQVEPVARMPLKQGPDEFAIEQAVMEQERLLGRTRGQLQNVIEELEAQNEEMQSMNEELQSSNEELQSSNEELETTNEELQSTNEELQTAYSELSVAYRDKESQQKELLQLRYRLEQSKSLLDEAERIGRTGSWSWNVLSRKVEWSDGCFRILGLDDGIFRPTYEAFIGVAHPEDRNRLESHMRDLLVSKGRSPFVFRAQDRDGNTITVSMEAVVSFNELKQAVRVMGSLTDVSETLSYERASAAGRNKIDFILGNSLNGNYLLDIDVYEIDFKNGLFTTLLGYEEEDLMDYCGDDFFTLFAQRDRGRVRQLIDEVRKGVPGSTYPLQYTMLTKDGDEKDVFANHTIFEINEGTGEAEKMLVNFFPSAGLHR